jgi:hypothetical protein
MEIFETSLGNKLELELETELAKAGLKFILEFTGNSIKI